MFNLLNIFRKIAIAEGISYILFGITMPLKYFYDMPEPNFYVGMAHGLLFGIYCLFMLILSIQFRWSFLKIVLVFAASLLPIGTFIAHKPLYNERQTLKQSITQPSKYNNRVLKFFGHPVFCLKHTRLIRNLLFFSSFFLPVMDYMRYLLDIHVLF